MTDTQTTTAPRDPRDEIDELGHMRRGMSDKQSLRTIDLLREAARTAESLGKVRDARGMLREAALIAESNLVGTDVISEYADFLDAHGYHGQAYGYRRRHEEVTATLKEHGGPFHAYEERLRAENATESPEFRLRVRSAVSRVLADDNRPHQAAAPEAPRPQQRQ